MPPDTEFDPTTKLLRQQIRRLRHLTRITQLTLVVAAMLILQAGRVVDTAIMLATAVGLYCVYLAARAQRFIFGTWILLGGLSTMLTFLAWYSHGLRDVVPLGLGGILVFSAMLGGRVQLWILTFLLCSLSLALAIAQQLGIHTLPAPLSPITTGLIVIGVLIALAYSTQLMARDYRAALTELAIENTRIKHAQSRIEQLALHDNLTQLPNRILTERLFYVEYEHSARAKQLLAVLLVDVDNLKRVNDSLGHNAGDQVLIEAAQRLQALLPEHAILGHYSGDKFIVILGQMAEESELLPLCNRILQSLSQTYYFHSLDIFCSVSIGAALAPDHGTDYDTLVRKADIAVHLAKDGGRNSVRCYEDAHKIVRMQQLGMVSDIQKGIGRNEFLLHYQPKINLHTNAITGLEALLRWRHPTQGYISPATFIPLAESSGLIIQLGEWLIEAVCRQIAAWRRLGMEDISVAINISCVQFKRGNLPDIIEACLERHAIPAHCLELELTESLIIEDNDDLQSTLKRLRQRGLQLAIDDFGTGYSNLGYLKRFEVGKLKIDQSFIHKLHQSSEDAAIVSAIIQLCDNLGLTSVAEGVEDLATADRLRALGCSEGQGYFWSKPLDAEAIMKFWQQWHQEAARLTAHTEAISAAAHHAVQSGNTH